MKRLTLSALLSLCMIFLALGCSGGGSPITPVPESGITNSQANGNSAQTHLWGYYDVYIDIENQTVEAVLNRMCMFTANVTTFVNNPVSNLSFKIYGTPATAEYVDVDINVTIKHPFPGMTQYNGYDVKGGFMGAGSGAMKYSSKLKHAEYGTDQAVYDFNDKDTLSYTDPYGDELVGMPDGYTRWFNAKEFIFPGIMGYTQGKLASPGYQSQLTATLNAYKYFADGLGADEDLWTWLGENADTNGVFSAGISNTRNYYLRFPTSGGVKYGYAVVASWKGPNPADHPANAAEAAACKIEITPDIYYAGGSNKGGSLILDISLWGWENQPSLIKLESTVLSGVHTFDATEMTPVGSGDNYATYRCQVAADNITGTEGNEFWVIAEYGDLDYTSASTPPGGAPTAVLAAFFRSDLYVSPTAYNQAPVCDLEVDGPLTGWDEVDCVFDATGTTDPDAGDTLTYAWDFNGNGTYGEDPEDDYTGDPDNPTHVYAEDYSGDVNMKVTDSKGAYDECQAAVDIDVTSSTLYLYDGTVDDGDMEEIGFLTGPAAWKFVDSENLWDEDGDTSYIDNDMYRTLATPKIDIPTGVSDLYLEVTHSGKIGSYYGNYSNASGMIGYTTDGGSSINFNETPCDYSATWLTFDSGTDFNFPSSYYGNLGFYSTYYGGCDPWGYWYQKVFCDSWGDPSSPVTSTWRCGSLIGQSGVQFCFNFNSCPSWLMWPDGNGWQLMKVKVYVEP